MKTYVAAKELDLIPYYDDLPSNGGKLSYITPQELGKKLGFQYTESLQGESDLGFVMNASLIQQVRGQQDVIPEEKIKERLQNPIKSIAIVNMGKELGHGTVALEDIPPETVLFLYAGTIEAAKPAEAGDNYASCYKVPEFKADACCVSAKVSGGLARFMPHTPTSSKRHAEYLKQNLLKRLGPAIQQSGINLDSFVAELMAKYNLNEELDSLKFQDPKTKEKIVTVNVAVETAIVDNTLVQVGITHYGIKRGEFVCTCYGDAWWKAIQTEPRYILQDGQLIPTDAYRRITQPDSVSVQALVRQKQPKPEALYQEAVSHHRKNENNTAIQKLQMALQLFTSQSKDKESATCHSTLASCYRDIKEYDKACEHAEANLIFTSSNNPAALPASQKKYFEILTLKKYSVEDCSQDVIALYKAKAYVLSLHKAQYGLSLCENSPALENQAAFFHSHLASCYRELGDSANAIHHCKLAIDSRLKELGKDHPLTQKAQLKLDNLLSAAPPAGNACLA